MHAIIWMHMTPKQNRPPSLANFVQFCPILSNTMFDKIDPCVLFSARIILRAHSFGDVVARGYHLRVPLRRESREFGAPGG